MQQLSPYMARRVQRALDDNTAAAVVSGVHLENAEIIASRAIDLTARLSAEAERQSRHTPLDAERYQSFVDEFMRIAHGTLRLFGDQL
jgi:hypothetical protein